MAFNWTPNVSLNSIFNDKLYIPDYQRDYAWGEDQASDFIEDLIDYSKYRKGDDSYLLGQFIFYEEDNKMYIIDGQQRIVTTVIFMSVVRNIVNTFVIDKTDEDVNQFYSYIYNILGSEKKGDFKLTIKGNGHTYFEKHILRSEEPTTHSRLKATRNMFTVYSLFKNRILSDVENYKSDQDKFNRIYELTTNLVLNFLVSKITTKEMSQAYTIFETLNSRGKDLEPADLLKNYLFNKSKTSETLVKEQWNMVDNALDNAKESLTHLLRSYWNSSHEITRTKLLYRAISKNIKTEGQALDFVNGLAKVHEAYLSMRKPDSFNYFENKQIIERFIGLKLLNAKLYYPIVLACVNKDVDKETLVNILSAIETLIVRNIVIGPENANKFESIFSAYACEISSGVDANKVISKIKSVTIDDDLFSSYFQTASIKETTVSRYILTEIYNIENGGELKINTNSAEVNLEHIMPQNKKRWNVSEEDHKRYLYYLGNQTLLLSSDNTSASNDSFSEKKIIYSRSKLKQNQELMNYNVWGKEEIETRQDRLLKTALKRWKV